MDSHLLRYRKDIKYCFVDLETFNLALTFKQNRIWQAGLLEVVGENIINSHDIRIKTLWSDAPYLQIGSGAATITKFNKEQHDKLSIDQRDAFYKIWEPLKNCQYIVGHNLLSFDCYLLRDYAKLMGEEWKWIIPKIIDTKALAYSIKINNPFNPQNDNFIEWQYRMANDFRKGIKTNLGGLAKEYEIPIDESKLHEAIYDLEINLAVWNKLKWLIEL